MRRLRANSLAWFLYFLAGAASTLGGGIANGPEHEGAAVDCDLPLPLRVRNTGGIDGQGLCVWASIEMAARYQNCKEVMGVFDYMKTQSGGGWPERVDRIMKDRAPSVKYRQYMGDSLDFIQDGIDSGRMVCVTYGYGELYNMQTISHMVACCSLNDKWAAIIDNNDPEHIWWMERDEFRKRFIHPGGSGWAMYTLAPAPPPVPHQGD